MNTKHAAHVKIPSGNYFPSGVSKLGMNPNSELQLNPGNHQLEEANDADCVSAVLYCEIPTVDPFVLTVENMIGSHTCVLVHIPCL